MSTDTFQITGLNTVDFTSSRYNQSNPQGMSRPLTKAQALQLLPRLPLEIRGHILSQKGAHVLSVITFDFDIVGSSGTDMEDAEHDLLETLQDTLLYFSTRGARGTKGHLVFKKDGASATSYKSLFYGELDEQMARAVLAAPLMNNELLGMRLTLYCEPYWHPSSTTNLVNAQTIYNHDDDDTGHNNYVDIAAANIKGDVPCRLLMRVEFDQKAASDYTRDLIVGRRTRATISNFVHWMEAEDFQSKQNWAASALARCSDGSRVTDSAATSGVIKVDVSSLYGNIDDFTGSFDVFAGLYTDDASNTKFRLAYDIGAAGYSYNPWIWLEVQSEWQLAYIGEIHFSQYTRSGVAPDNLYIAVEYEKDASDTAECDFIWLVPRDEPRMRLDCIKGPATYTSLAIGEWWVVSNAEDFDYVGKESGATPEWVFPLNIHGDIISLHPGIDNRLYFTCISLEADSGVSEEYECHGTTDLAMKVTVDYLPQYISPLE